MDKYSVEVKKMKIADNIELLGRSKESIDIAINDLGSGNIVFRLSKIRNNIKEIQENLANIGGIK
jgi:16S rRNA U1498 N3-methylase RsmE